MVVIAWKSCTLSKTTISLAQNIARDGQRDCILENSGVFYRAGGWWWSWDSCRIISELPNIQEWSDCQTFRLKPILSKLTWFMVCSEHRLALGHWIAVERGTISEQAYLEWAICLCYWTHKCDHSEGRSWVWSLTPGRWDTDTHAVPSQACTVSLQTKLSDLIFSQKQTDERHVKRVACHGEDIFMYSLLLLNVHSSPFVHADCSDRTRRLHLSRDSETMSVKSFVPESRLWLYDTQSVWLRMTMRNELIWPDSNTTPINLRIVLNSYPRWVSTSLSIYCSPICEKVEVAASQGRRYKVSPQRHLGSPPVLRCLHLILVTCSSHWPACSCSECLEDFLCLQQHLK